MVSSVQGGGASGANAAIDRPRKFSKETGVSVIMKQASGMMQDNSIAESISNLLPRAVQGIFTRQVIGTAFTIGTLGIAGAHIASGLASAWQRLKAIKQAGSAAEKATQMASVSKLFKDITPVKSLGLLAVPIIGTMIVSKLISQFKKKTEYLKPIQSNIEFIDEETSTTWKEDKTCSTENGKYEHSTETKEIMDNIDKKIIVLRETGQTISTGIALFGPGGTGKSHLSDIVSEKFFAEMDKQGKQVARFRITPADFHDHGPEKLDKVLEGLRIIKENSEKDGYKKGVGCILQFEEMDAVFSKPEQQKQFQTFTDTLRNEGIDACYVGTTNETGFIQDASGEENTGFKRRLDWVEIGYPDRDTLSKVFEQQLEELKFNRNPLNDNLRKTLTDLLNTKLGSEYNSTDKDDNNYEEKEKANKAKRKMTPAALKKILENTRLKLIDVKASEGKSTVEYIKLEKGSVTEAFNNAYAEQMKQMEKDLTKGTKTPNADIVAALNAFKEAFEEKAAPAA